ncbi:MAG TPA: GTP-binding protein [Burkholderiales bacterium]|jgi:G3E family GTPase|nr:GTP-binding protein [Burkholderiales bacterium]
MPKDKLPVALLTGFLGSGKTLLLNRLLQAADFANTAVIVNEFGEIGLDHVLVQPGTDNVVLLEAGCLCCTIADSLHETLADLHFRRVRREIPPFERVVIETTGLADPAPILNTLLGHKLVTDFYRLDAVVVTVDAMHAAAQLERHREVVKQIAVADRLVITKADAVPAAQVAELRARLAGLNPSAEVFESRHGSAALAAFHCVEPVRQKTVPAFAPPHQHEHDANRHDEHVRAHCFVLDAPVSWSGLAAWCRIVTEELGERLLRCKGLVEIADSGEIVFVQGVQRVFHSPQRLPGWPDADHRSRLVCITRDAEEPELRRTLPALKIPAGSDPNITLADLEVKW